MAKKEARIITPEQAQHLRGHCGDVIRLLSSEDKRPANFDHVKIDYAIEHMHTGSTEYYYVLRGKGCITLDGTQYCIYKGCLVEIPPGVWHMAEDGLEVLVIGVPPVKKDDVHYRDDQ